MAHWNLLALIGTGTVFAACNSGGGGGGGGTPGPEGGMAGDGAMTDTSSSGDSGSGSDTGAAGDSSGSGDDGGTISCTSSSVDAGGLEYTGVVELSRVGVPTPVRYNALAQIETTAESPPSGCTGMLVGACCYQTSSSDGGLPTLESAGNITITDGTSTLATLMPPGYVATSASDPTLTWMPGDMLVITAAGATVGAFTATVPAPAYFAAVMPPFDAPIAVKTSSDLVVSWTPGKRPCSKVSVGLTQGALLPYIGCVVDDSTGTVTVPASLIGMFTGTSGTAVIERVEGARVLASNANIGVAAINVQTTTTTYMP
jgi:hypothetical protein